MVKKQSRSCRNGAQCQIEQCRFRHPDKLIFAYETEPMLPQLNDQKQKDGEEAMFLDGALHTIYMNDITSAIIYTAWDEDEPYVIETFPELGLFASWDEAYDALLNFIYRSEITNGTIRGYAEDPTMLDGYKHSEAMENTLFA